jgi:hypothetical protein
LSPKIILFNLLACTLTSYSQSITDASLNEIDAGKLSAVIERKLIRLEDKIIVKSEKALERLQKQEARICEKRLASKDSVQTKLKLMEVQSQYKVLEERWKNASSLAPSNIIQYIPYFDTLSSVLKFLDHNNATANLNDAFARIESFNDRLQQAQNIKDFIREREEMLRQELRQFGIVKELKKFNKEVHYYSEQLKEYIEILSDPTKIEKKAIDLLSKTKVFQDFMRRNSLLASLVRLPGDPDDPAFISSSGSLQTRSQVNNLIQQEVGAGGLNADAQFQQNIREGQSQMQQLKHKLMQSGKGSSDDIMPHGFKPRNQKTKSFLQRLEYATNIQAQRATNFFPATTDVGLSVGYKLNDKSILGIGASYKVGLGRGWNDLELSSQGAGVRSYVDWKLKRSIWVSGGYEMNYKSQLRSVPISSPFGGREETAWRQSGLVGLSKVFDVKSKYFKKTKLQLLWDFLSYQQVPRTHAVLFRIEYGFK